MHALSNATTTVTETALWPLRTIRQSLSETLGTLDIFLGGFGLVAALVVQRLGAVVKVGARAAALLQRAGRRIRARRQRRQRQQGRASHTTRTRE